MTDMQRQNWDQDQSYQLSPGYYVEIDEMTNAEIAEAFGQVAMMPDIGGLTSSLLFQALRNRSKDLQNAHD